MSRTAQKAFLLVLLLVLALSFSFSSAESYDASTMRLLRHEGNVEIFDVSGQARFLMDNVRFASGEAMRTGEDGKASVGLDDTKIVTMDASSRVEFMQEADHIRLNLTEGTLLLDVQQKLDENEGLDIQTSTMTVGIRGTVLFVSQRFFAGDPSLAVSSVGVLQGIGEITFTDASGATRRIPVPAGKIARVTGTMNADASGTLVADDVQIVDMTVSDVAGFVADQVLSDQDLARRVTNGSPSVGQILNGQEAGGNSGENPYPADGDWTWPDKISLVAQSASKIYDGTPLTRPSGVLVYGLPGDFTIEVSASGSQTDAGTTANEVSSYRILNADKEDVTSHFTNVEKISGSLVVDPVPLVVWTDSAVKYYDGEPLTCPRAEIRTVTGYEVTDPAWRNSSLVTQTALGSEKMVAVSGRTYVHGTNPLTGATQQLELLAGQSLSVCLHGEGENQSLEFQIVNLTEEELPEEVLRLYADNPDLLAQACLDTGWDPDLMARLIAALPAENAETVTRAGLIVPDEAKTALMTDATDVRIHIDSDITNYSSRPLGEEEAHFTPITLDPSIVITATGSQTEPGESLNTYTIDWGTANRNNYVLRDDLGTLTVLALREEAVVITAGSSEKVYDGTELCNNTYTVRGLPEGYTARATVRGTITEAGEAANQVTSVTILDIDGNNAYDQFSTVRWVNGTLTVTPLQVSVSLGGSATVTYSGSPYIPSPVATYQNGPHSGESVQGIRIQTSSGHALRYLAAAGARLRGGLGAAKSFTYRFTFFTGDTADLTLSGISTDAGSHALSASVSSSSSSVRCSSGSEVTITVQPASLSVSTGTAEKTYDGTPLTCSEVTVSGLVNGDNVTVTAAGSQTEVGSSYNTYTVDWGSVNPDNYEVSATLGILTVTEAAPSYGPVTFTAPSSEKVYDGTPLNAGAASAEGLPDGFTFTAVVSGSRTDAGESESSVTSYTIRNAEGTDVTSSFTDVTLVPGKLTVTPAELTIASGSAQKAYDGEPLTSSEVTVTGLAANDTVTATASGTQTDAGESSNTITVDWGNVSKSNYTVTETVGKLTVTPAELTISSGSAQKAYDGEPLTSSEVTVTGLAANDAITVTASGSQTDAGESENTFTVEWGDVNKANYTVTETVGKLTVTPAEVTIISASAEKVYDGEPLTAGVTVTGLASNETITVTATGSQTDVGESENTFTVEWGDVNKANYTVTETAGTLTVTPAEVTIVSASAEKLYDGEPLTADEISVTGLADGESISADVTGSQTDAGESENTFTVEWGDVNKANYTVTETAGTLTVTKRSVILTSADAEKTYDGEALVNETVTVGGDGFAEGEGAEYVFADIMQLDAGSSTNSFTYELQEGTNAANYEITKVEGTLTVTPLPLYFNLGGGTFEYYQEELNEPSVTVNGSVLYGDMVDTDDGWYTEFTLPNEDVVRLTVSGYSYGSPVGEYTLTGNADFTAGNASNYEPHFDSGNIITIEPYKLTIQPVDSQKVYDGKPGPDPESASVTFSDYNFEGIEATVVFDETDDANVGTHTIMAEITDWGDANEQNYDIDFQPGTLTIQPRPVTLTSATNDKQYDGTPLTDDTVTEGGDGFVEGEGATYTVTGTVTYPDSVNNDFTYKLNEGTSADNYEITTETGTLTVTKRSVTLTSGSASKKYDGSALTNDEVSVTGDGFLDGDGATYDFTGTQTEIGDSPNYFTYKLNDGTNPNYYDIEVAYGTLTVEAGN